MTKMTPSAVVSTLLAAGDEMFAAMTQGKDAMVASRESWKKAVDAAKEFQAAQAEKAKSREETREFEITDVTVVSEKKVTAFAKRTDGDHKGRTNVVFFNDNAQMIIEAVRDQGVEVVVGEGVKKITLEAPIQASVTGTLRKRVVEGKDKPYWDFNANEVELKAALTPAA